MPLSGRLIRSRIKSVKNTKKITRAMELVSAAKMRRAVGTAVSSRTYAEYAWELLTRLNDTNGNGAAREKNFNAYMNVHAVTAAHPLLVVRPVKKILTIVVSSNRGLAGAFNANIYKKVLEEMRDPARVARHRTATGWLEPAAADPEMSFVVVGKRGENAVRKISKNIVASFVDVRDVPTFADAAPIIKLATDAYAAGEYDKVVIVYTHYISGLTQKTKIRQLLPVSRADLEKTLFPDGAAGDGGHRNAPADHHAWAERFVLFEPDINKIISHAVTRLIEAQVFQSLLESAASEQSARMMAMRQATDAATEMIDSLTLAFNQARQGAITREISEISAGKAALE